jgi:hypothetical protein
MDTEIEDIGLVKINYTVFKKCLANFNSSNIIISDNIVTKANELINTYNCFVSTYDARSLWEKKKIIASNKAKTPKARPHIIYIDFSDDAKCKKEFISYLNKLTDVNKDTIYSKISTFITQVNPEILTSLFDVLINFIKSSNNSIYIDVLYLFEPNYIETNIEKYYTKYLAENEWLPNIINVEYKSIFSEEYYDIYCEYVKLKKSTISMIKALCIILKKINKMNIIEEIIDNIFIALDKYIITTDYKHINELLLDELTIVLDFIPKQKYFDKISSINTQNLDTSTKFKIANIKEKYD